MTPQRLALALAATALAATALAASILPAVAQDKSGTNLGPAAASGAAPGGAATVILASELYAFGASQGDAVTVLAAAKLAASVEMALAEPAALDPARVTIAEGPGQTTLARRAAPAAPAAQMTDGSPRATAKATFFTATSNEEGKANAPLTAEAMFAKARALGGDDDAILGLIDDAMADTTRGRVGGAVEWRSPLPPGQTDVWEISFAGNSHAEVAIVGDGDANLDAAVTDENGNVICYDVSGSDTLYCDWTPAWDGYFYVTVQNTGNAQNSYSLVTN